MTAQRAFDLVQPEEQPEGEERQRKRYSDRPCPECGIQTMMRVPLQRHLRPLRRFGFNLRRYTCGSCGTISVIRR